MTRDDYRRAVGCFEPDGYLKERIAANMERAPRRRTRVLRRALVGVLAAAVALASMTGIAMAASPEIRKAVLSFLHLGEVEQVPNSASVVGEYPLQGTDIGGRVTAWYVDMESMKTYFDPNRAVFGGDGSVEAIIDWEISDGVLRECRFEPRVTRFSLAPFGVDCEGEIAWYADDGQALVYADGYDGASGVSYTVNAIAGRDDAALLYVHVPDGPAQTGTETSAVPDSAHESGRGAAATPPPVPIDGTEGTGCSERVYICDLETGALTDVFGGTEAEALEDKVWYSWSPDLARALIVCSGEEDTTWYFERGSGSATEISALTGTGATEAFFLDGGTLFVYDYAPAASPDAAGSIDGWTYRLDTGELTRIFDGAPEYVSRIGGPGVSLCGGRYCVWADGDGGISVVDLMTGEKTPVEGAELPAGAYFMANNAGTRIMYMGSSESGDSYGALGVIDLERGEFVAFSRENAGDVDETMVSWFDDEMIAVYGETPEGQVYMYIYEFT